MQSDAHQPQQPSPGLLPEVPHFYHDLRLALAVLYSLPLPASQQQLPSPAQAHDFLIHIQSRNARRKIRSAQQKQRDMIQKQQQQQAAAPRTPIEPKNLDRGSSWLACLAILCQVHSTHNSSSFVASSAERLFAAQTLLHRLRRVPVADAVDIEMELMVGSQAAATTVTWDGNQSLGLSYSVWMRNLHPTITNVLDAYHQHHQNSNNSNEHTVKAELTVLTLAAVSFYIAAENHHQSGSSGGGPLLTTTLSAMATAVLKLRHNNPLYANNVGKDNTATDNSHNRPTVINLVREAFGVVWNQVLPLYGEESHSCLQTCLFVCLGAIPDTVLGNPGGARGRLSMDPRSVQTAIRELRVVELPLMWQVIVEQQQHASSNGGEGGGDNDMLWILRTCERWARFLPLPAEMVQHTVPQIGKYLAAANGSAPEYRKAALGYLLALVESASWTVDQVISSCLGLSESQQNHQAKKKRQTSKSKKRHQEVIARESSDDTRSRAQAEVHHRGSMACHAVLVAWDPLNAVAREAIAAGAANGGQADGEGPIGCVAACANSCLPHILRHPDTPHGLELFQAIADVFHLICSSPNSTIRALSFEPLHSLHACLVEVVRARAQLGDQMESLVVNYFFKCALSLASACGYPSNYFDNLGAQSDEDIEIERNDIRDILRTVAGSGEAGSTSDAVSQHRPLGVTTEVLFKILHSCSDAVTAATQKGELFPETAAHAFSSLAKPLNFIARCNSSGDSSDHTVENLLDLATVMLCRLCQSTVHAFQRQVIVAEILPLARIVDIAIASLSPMIAARCSILMGRENSETSPNLANVLHLVLEVSILSIEHLPELASDSTLGHSTYDIRGTMRGPGGEDHVGCLSLMRISKETPELTLAVVESVAPFIARLCKLHQQLKIAEQARGVGVFHGTGVTPVSRRILLGVLCHLEIVSHGRSGASTVLQELFLNAMDMIASCGSRNLFDESMLYQMAEATFDLASFSPATVFSLFTVSDPERTACLEALTRLCIAGYQHVSTSSGDVAEATVQWNRLRAAMFQLLSVATTSGVSDRVAEILRACIVAECEAIQRQCSAGPQSPSSIFNDDIVSPDSVPAGVFVRVIGEALLCESMESRANCVRVLVATKDLVIGTIVTPCPEPHRGAFVDPRPTLAEAWFQTMAGLSTPGQDPNQELLLVDTSVAAVSLLFFPGMGKTEAERQNDPGMSLDGAQSLAMITLLGHFFKLGPTALESLSHRLAGLIHIDEASIKELPQERMAFNGVCILGAALFRAGQGAMPPWGVESFPELYSALYGTLGKDPGRFGSFLRLSMEVRLSPQASFWSVKPGHLLSGPCFQGMSDVAKNDFVHQTVELCSVDDAASWRRVKFLVKQICGGKKRDTDFKQKPSLTRWEFTRH